MRFLCPCSTLGLVSLVLLTTPAEARTWHVFPGGGGDAGSIQAAVDSASAGDTVLVACGTYYEHDIILKSGLCLRGEAAPEGCVTLDAHHNGRALACENATAVRIESLTLAHGYQISPHHLGAGLACINSAVEVKDVSFIANGAYQGGALLLDESTAHLTGCRFTENGSISNGGAVTCDKSNAWFTGCVFSDNSAGGGGGAVVCFNESNASFVDCEFVENVAGKTVTATFGGALYFNWSPCVITRCLFRGNSSPGYGGAVWVNNSPGKIALSTFDGNQSSEGGGVYIGTDGFEIESCTFVRNSANIGGGILSSTSLAPQIRGTIIAYSSKGGAVQCGAGYAKQPPVLSCCDLYGNTGGDWAWMCIWDNLDLRGNVMVDPGFCNLDAGDYTLATSSLCLPDNQVGDANCGLMGAWGSGCAQSPVERVTWSSLKNRFR